MIQKDFRPLAILYGYKSKRNALTFIGRKKLITLSGKSGVQEKILRYCNGFNTIADISRKIRTVSLEDVTEFLSLFQQQGIVCDSRDLYLRFHEDSTNPSKFSHDLGTERMSTILGSERLRKREGTLIKIPDPVKSNILDIIRNRVSTRNFEPSRIPLDQLSGILNATYGIGKNNHWSVASGGGMYPLDLYLIIPSDDQYIARGVYRWNPGARNLVTISNRSPNIWLSKTFNAKTLLENASCILCIGSNFKCSGMKYANLAYRLALLEAGHAIQNTYLFCTEQNIGIVEYCGFSDEALADELGLEFPNEVVLATLIIGKVSTSLKISISDKEVSETAEQLRYKLVGDNKPIRDVLFLDLKVGGYAMPLWSATASYRPVPGHLTASIRRKSVAFATGSTSSEALIKVLAEGFERYALEQNRSDLRESALNLKEPFLDPRILIPYTEAQLKNLRNVTKFNPRKEIEWVLGSSMVNGERVWVPTELVFYATEEMKRKSKLLYQSSSSGVAAHFDKEIAINTALYELIERDAFSVTWYSKRQVNSIKHKCLPSELRDRISEWNKLGYKVTVLDLTIDGPPVALVIIWSREKRPAICSGASCRPNFVDAITKAFNEAEFMAMTWHYQKSKSKMTMFEIDSPESHGVFYLNPKNLIYADWLLEAKESESLRADFKSDLEYLDPVVVDITPKIYICDLSVVRVFSEKLMPINFGYGNEHRGHARMKMLSYKWNEPYPSTPHFFA
ncbi:MAG: YcaO-like family protein [Candidatus Taylorbacteria bacterium]|nr:YcaO-like family protein [Candidatus Taylorbacteria bacterium]